MRKTLLTLTGAALITTVGACSYLPSMRSPEERLSDTIGQPTSTVSDEIKDITCDLLDEGESPYDVVMFFVDNYHVVPFSADRMGGLIYEAVDEECPEHYREMHDMMQIVGS